MLVSTSNGGSYPVHFGRLASLPARLEAAGLAPGPCLVVTDAHVAPLWLGAVVGPLAEAGWTPHARAVPAGETSKSLDVLGALYDWALGLGVERSTPVFALGGGVVGDLAGFAAATLLRGLPLAHLPTSVVAQVDSALGGKTGVNHARGKNLIGAFYPPRLILADPATLATLSERDYRSGLAEVVKHALLEGEEAVARLERDADRLLAREPDAVAEMVRQAAAFKAAVVSEDEHEAGRRAFLNLGHTFGHAIETAAGYGAFTHGEAVALGLRAALYLSASLAVGQALPPGAPLPPPFGRADRLVACLVPAASLEGVPQPTLDAALGLDKKRLSGQTRFVVLDGLGSARVAADMPAALVEAAWARARHVGGGDLSR